MQCEETQKLFSIFIDNELESNDRQKVHLHIMNCRTCHREMQSMRRVWDALELWSDIEPSSDYVNRFWVQLPQSRPLHKKILKKFEGKSLKPGRLPVVIFSFVLLIASFPIIQYYTRLQATEMLLTSMTKDNVDMYDSLEFMADYEIVDNLEFLEELELLKNLDVPLSQ